MASFLSNLTSTEPPKKTNAMPNSPEGGDDWGDFDQYEDPNDVQFPTLSPSPSAMAEPTLESFPSMDSQQNKFEPTGAKSN